MSQSCVWNVLRCSGRMERRGFVTGLVPDLWNVMNYKLYKYILYIYIMYTVYMYIIYISTICTLKLLPLAAAHFHFSSARHPCCTPVQPVFALHGYARTQPVASGSQPHPLATMWSCPLSCRPVTQVPPPTLKTQRSRSLWGRLCPRVARL